VPELEAEGFGSGGIVQNRLMCEVRVADERIGRWKPPGRCCERSEADFAASRKYTQYIPKKQKNIKKTTIS